MKTLTAFLVVALAQLVTAQIIYEPVRYQHGDRYPFYYGGADPAAVARLDSNACGDARYRPQGEPAPVYSDCLPGLNARYYGYRACDAANEAAVNTPRYFRKAHLLASAVPSPDGFGWVVPPFAPYVGANGGPAPRPAPTTLPTTRPATRPGVIIIIPLKKPAPPPADTRVAAVKQPAR